MNFEQNVFINCPFDIDYRPLLRPLLFTILYLELTPHISETKSSGDVRVNEIKKLIRQSKYSIHDISRNESGIAGEMPRFNMPFELGLDIGFKNFWRWSIKGQEMFDFRQRKIPVSKIHFRYRRAGYKGA